MRIGISCYPTHGGSGVVATELGMALAGRGHQVHFICYSVPFRLHRFHPNVCFHEVETMTYPLFRHPPYELALANKMAEIAQSEGLDILHAHYAIPHAICAYLAKKICRSPEPKVITTLHGTDITLVGLDRSFYQVVKFCIEESDAVTAVSHYLKQKTIEEFKITREIEVIHNFVDPEKFRRLDGLQKQREQFAPEGEKILIHVSNFRRVKRLCDVVRILVKVREKVDVKLILVGEGQDKLTSQKLVTELGVNEHVYFLGNQDFLEPLLSISDLFLLPSEVESFGLSALEAMSCGVPVIGTAVGGLPEVVSHGETGFLHPVGDIEGMAQSAIRLLTDDSLWTQFSWNARQRAVKCFNIRNYVPKYEALYQKVLESR